jgi:hypothetical protein
MRIGFCTAAMNRRWQLEKTLPENLASLRGSGHFLALVDYNSSDGLCEMVQARLAGHVEDGTLLYFHTVEPRGFHASLAKNLGHRLALQREPDVLFNLDADNFIAPETIAALEGLFGGERRACFHNWSRQWTDGSFGRIAMRSDDWVALGGYDESFLPMTWQDVDLLLRARAVGLEYVAAHPARAAVENTQDDKIRNLAERPGEEGAAERPADLLKILNRENMARSFGRPVRLPFAEQRPARGRLNFASATVTI